MNQLRGMVTLCGTRFGELTERATMNSPESLSARSHSGVRSAYVWLEMTSLGEQIRRDVRGFTYLPVRTVNTMNQRSINRAFPWL